LLGCLFAYGTLQDIFTVNTGFIKALTDSGDLAVLMPLAIVLSIWIVLQRRSDLTASWIVALGICIGGTALLKIYFFACPPLSTLHNPSGHSSLSVLVYGTLALAITAVASGWQRWVIAIAAGVFVLGIGFSRVLVEFHTIPEVLLGFTIGGAALALFATNYLRRPRPTKFLPQAVIGCAALMVLLNGREVRAEELLHHLSTYFKIASLACR
jgi:membrane-associated phospholipid phosphatase